MKITVDLDLCEGHGQCVMVASEVFHLADGADQVVLLQDSPPEALHDEVSEAAQLCPATAIAIED